MYVSNYIHYRAGGVFQDHQEIDFLLDKLVFAGSQSPESPQLNVITVLRNDLI